LPPAAMGWQNQEPALESAARFISMARHVTNPENRIRASGFTLIEVLVVTAIIGILISLLLAGLFKARAIQEDVEARKDITELHKAVGAFSTDARLGAVGYMPSRICLGNTLAADPASVSYLQRLFPKCDVITVFGTSPSGLPAGSGQLHGDQCLV